MATETSENAVSPAKEEETACPGSSCRIDFPNGNTAKLINTPVNAEPDDFLERLDLPPPKALIIAVTGAKGFDEATRPRLYQLFSRGIARAAANIDALIIDGGTCSGGMAMMGESVADRGYKSALIGISPAGRVTWPGHPDQDKTPLDPNHTHFILVDTPDWSGEISTKFRFAEHLRGNNDIPVITVLANGGKISRTEVLSCVRLGSPVIVFKGTGRLADEIAELHENPPDFIEDPELAEIVQEGDIHLFSLESSVTALERLISRQVRRDSMLRLAWQQFGVYDLNAIRQQQSFQHIQDNIIWLGVLGTALALIQSSLIQYGIIKESDGFSYDLLHYAIVAVPILISILIAAANEFKSGNKWIMLRGSAELLKSEIFRHRARVETREASRSVRESRLAEKLEQISNRLMQTEANLSALKAYEGPLPPKYGTGPGDDGFSRLTPEQYLTNRLEDQLNFYVSKTEKVEKQLRLLEWLIYIIGGLGTLLAAVGLELWVALTNSLVAAFGAFIKHRMLQESLTKYNQAATALTNVRCWWISLPAAEQAKKSNINLLVENTEGILRSEFSSWVQEMQDRITELQEEEEGEADSKNQEGEKKISDLK
ncbi:MAG: SLATT domain-containing protein [Desulfobacterales bacterium]|nr:SLATT domain-containing protein [Desulfobacterales bacterium]